MRRTRCTDPHEYIHAAEPEQVVPDERCKLLPVPKVLRATNLQVLVGRCCPDLGSVHSQPAVMLGAVPLGGPLLGLSRVEATCMKHIRVIARLDRDW